MYLAHLFRHQNKREWGALKERLEAFGSAAGLFDELSIKSLGVRESQQGNVLQAPASYGQFFVDEVDRSLRY